MMCFIFRHVHAACDPILTTLSDKERHDYLCPICKNRDPNVSSYVT